MCSIEGCNNVPSKYSPMCLSHIKAQRRHGHPLQCHVTRIEVARYEKTVCKYLDKRASPEAWTRLTDAWQGVCAIASTELSEFFAGSPKPKHKMTACDIILKANKSADSRNLVATLMAYGLMAESDPKRFLSEKALVTQAMAGVRKYTAAFRMERFDPMTGALKYQYRMTPMKVTEAMWEMLGPTFVKQGVLLGKKLLAEADKKAMAKSLLRESVLSDRYEGGMSVAPVPQVTT